jgi:tyrosinase
MVESTSVQNDHLVTKKEAGNVHNMVGGYGHMYYPEVSAFDPIFWLHHANVDRLLAMWQVLNPDKYIEPAVNVWGTYYESPGTVESGGSSLAPFHSDNGTSMWTSDTVRDLSVFNYAYPEIPYWGMNATELANYVRLQVNMKYNPAVASAHRKVRRRPLLDDNLHIAFKSMSHTELRSLRVNNADFQWTIRIVMDRYAYNTGFSLDFFMGLPPDDVSMRATACNLIGTQASFITSNVSAMFPSGPPEGSAQGELSLTHILAGGMSRGYLADLSPDSVVPVLQRALTWRARLPNGEELDVAAIKGLSISVGSKATTPAASEYCFPRYAPTQWHPEATRGKIGGSGCS